MADGDGDGGGDESGVKKDGGREWDAGFVVRFKVRVFLVFFFFPVEEERRGEQGEEYGCEIIDVDE